MNKDATLDDEISSRLKKPNNSYQKLSKRVFNNRDLTIQTKISVYKSMVLTVLLCGGET